MNCRRFNIVMDIIVPDDVQGPWVPWEDVAKLQEEIEKHRWLPVEERLPENEKKVMVTNGRYTWTDCYSPSCKGWKNLILGGGDLVLVEYTHWKPIILPT